MRTSRMFALAALTSVWLASTAMAGYHGAIDRDLTLNQIEQIATDQAAAQAMPADEANKVVAIVTELRDNTGAPTSVDMKKLDQIQSIFDKYNVKSARLDGAILIVAERVDDLKLR